MARFDLYAPDHGAGMWLDCQGDRLAHLSHRFVVPLMTRDDAPRPGFPGLNPELDIDGSPWVMMTQFASSVPLRELGKPVGRVEDDDHRIVRALDTLIGTA